MALTCIWNPGGQEEDEEEKEQPFRARLASAMPFLKCLIPFILTTG